MKNFQNNWFYYSYPYAVVVFFIFMSTPLPEGQQGAKAEELTDKIQAAINQTAWDSTTVCFSFRNHHYLWDKKHNLVQVEWDDKRKCFIIRKR
jgi:hypothetical protein